MVACRKTKSFRQKLLNYFKKKDNKKYIYIAVSLYTETTTLQLNILTSAFSTFFRHFLSIQKKLLQVKFSKLKKIALIRFIRHKPKKSAERFLYTGSTLAVNY